MLPPVLLPESGRLLEELAGGLALAVLGEAGDAQLGWVGEEEVHVVATHVAFQDLHLVRDADLPEEVANAEANPTHEDGTAVLRTPDEVHLEVVDGVGTVPVELHVPRVSPS